MNIWADYFNGWNRENHDFPFTTRQGKTFDNTEQLLKHISKEYGNDSSQGLYYSCMLEFPLNLIWDRQIQSWIERYVFCEKFNVAPYKADGYDELPAVWVDFCKMMLNELAECEKEQMRKNK